MNLKNWKLFTSKFFGTGPSTYEKKNLPGRGPTKVEKHCYTTVWKADTVAGGKLQLASLISQTLKNHWASSVCVRAGRAFISFFTVLWLSFRIHPTAIFCTSINTGWNIRTIVKIVHFESNWTRLRYSECMFQDHSSGLVFSSVFQ